MFPRLLSSSGLSRKLKLLLRLPIVFCLLVMVRIQPGFAGHDCTSLLNQFVNFRFGLSFKQDSSIFVLLKYSINKPLKPDGGNLQETTLYARFSTHRPEYWRTRKHLTGLY